MTGFLYRILCRGGRGGSPLQVSCYYVTIS